MKTAMRAVKRLDVRIYEATRRTYQGLCAALVESFIRLLNYKRYKSKIPGFTSLRSTRGPIHNSRPYSKSLNTTDLGQRRLEQ